MTNEDSSAVRFITWSAQDKREYALLMAAESTYRWHKVVEEIAQATPEYQVHREAQDD